MENKENIELLRIFLGESDKYKRKPLYEHIVIEAKKSGMAGATVTRGIMGFGANSAAIKSSKIFAISLDMPLIIEIVDQHEKIEGFIEKLQEWFDESKVGVLITIEKATVIRYRSSGEEN